MSLSEASNSGRHGWQISLRGLQFAVFSTRNFVFLLAVLAMNFTLFRPSPVDLLYITAFLLTLFYLTLSPRPSLWDSMKAWPLLFVVTAAPYHSQSLDSCTNPLLSIFSVHLATGSRFQRHFMIVFAVCHSLQLQRAVRWLTLKTIRMSTVGLLSARPRYIQKT